MNQKTTADDGQNQQVVRTFDEAELDPYRRGWSPSKAAVGAARPRGPRKPVVFRPITDIFEGYDGERPETTEERTKRLKAERRKALSDVKRRSAVRMFETGASEAALRIKLGHPYPVHYDVVWLAGEYSETRRLSFVEAAIVRQLDKLCEPTDSPNNLVMTGPVVHIRTRRNGIPPHFVVRFDEIE